MVRLSYKRTPEGKQSNPVLLGTEYVYVVVDFREKRFKIVSVNDGRTLTEGVGSNEGIITMNARKQLNHLGVNFDSEVRQRRTDNETVTTELQDNV